MCLTASRNERPRICQRAAYEDQSVEIKRINKGRSKPLPKKKKTFSSVTFQSLIFAFGGSFDQDTYIPFTEKEAKTTSTGEAARYERVQQTIMEQLSRLVPLVRTELPCLPGSHHAHHPLPCVRTEFRERLYTVDHKIRRPCDRLLPAGVDRRAFAVDWNHVFWPDVALRGGARPGILRGLETRVLWMSEGGMREWMYTHTESSRKRFTLCIVMRAVGEEDIMMMGWLWPVKWH
jgi:hypothetical protein